MVCCQDSGGGVIIIIVIIIILSITSGLAYPEKRVSPLRNHPRPSLTARVPYKTTHLAAFAHSFEDRNNSSA